VVEQAASIPTMQAVAPPFFNHTVTLMALLFLEALGALVILVLIVWWTMFSGRDNGELRNDGQDAERNGTENNK
jgi:hypothetical protein